MDVVYLAFDRENIQVCIFNSERAAIRGPLEDNLLSWSLEGVTKKLILDSKNAKRASLGAVTTV